MDPQGYITPHEVRQALSRSTVATLKSIYKTPSSNPFLMNSNPSMRRAAGNPVRCLFSRWSCCALFLGSLCISQSEGADESILR